MLVLTDIQKVALSIEPKTAAGNPAAIDGVPVWSTSAPDVVTVNAADDGMSAEVITVGPLGAAQISVVADADLGEGVVEITGLLDIEVIASQAATLGIAAGTPEPR